MNDITLGHGFDWPALVGTIAALAGRVADLEARLERLEKTQVPEQGEACEGARGGRKPARK